MIARLVLVLMLAMAAIPGMATGSPCHESPGRAMAMSGMPGHHDRTAPAEHRCIGCMPLPDVAGARPVFGPARVVLPRPLPARLDLRAGVPPAAPPPRIG